MKRKRDLPLFIAVALVVLLACGVLVKNSLPRSSHLQLPDVSAGVEQPGTGGGTDNALTRLEVTPQTVQAVIATLERPGLYARSVTTETLWSGGSGRAELTVLVSGVWNRVDMAMPSGRIRHSITDGERTYIWYDSSRDLYEGSSGTITADQEQHIPTYEDVLALDPEQITAADFRDLGPRPCVYVETAADEDGYVLRYWVEVETGLLAASERLQDGVAVYRTGASALDESLVTAESFSLPDGRVLHTP